MTIFIALALVIDNPDARATLERTFSTVVVATAREHAVTELTALGGTVDAAIIGVRERRAVRRVFDQLSGLWSDC